MQYTVIQKNLDAFPFNEAFTAVNQFDYATAGTVVFNQSLSFVSFATMQQQWAPEGTNGTLLALAENYVDYEVDCIDVTIRGLVNAAGSGSIAVLFVPDSVEVTSDNFISIVDARHDGKGNYPGVSFIKLSQLGSGLRTIKGLWTPGGRQIGLHGSATNFYGSTPRIGRLVIGFYATAFPVPVTVASSSTAGDLALTPLSGPCFRLTLHVGGNVLGKFPGQKQSSAFVQQLRTKLKTVGQNVHVDPVGFGDWVFTMPSAPADNQLASAIDGAVKQNSNNLLALNNSAIPVPKPLAFYNKHTDPPIVMMPMANGDYSVPALASTILNIGVEAIATVADAFFPGISTMLVIGGAVFDALTDVIVGTPSTMKMKENLSSTSNQIPTSNSVGVSINPTGLSLTQWNNGTFPSTTLPYSVPAASAVSAFISKLNTLATAQPTSIAAILYNILSVAPDYMGVFPSFFAADFNVDTNHHVEFDRTIDYFVKTGAQDDALVINEESSVGVPEDYLAGIPLATYKAPSFIRSFDETSAGHRQVFLVVSSDALGVISMDFYSDYLALGTSYFTAMASYSDVARAIWKVFGYEGSYDARASEYVIDLDCGYVLCSVNDDISDPVDSTVNWSGYTHLQFRVSEIYSPTFPQDAWNSLVSSEMLARHNSIIGSNAGQLRCNGWIPAVSVNTKYTYAINLN